MPLSRGNLKYGFVAFIDLLGFSARVGAIEEESELEAIELDVSRVQRWLQYKTSDDLEKSEKRITNKTVLAFSDCVVVGLPMRSKLSESQGSFDVWMSELHSLALTQGQCVANDIIIRGGVDIGFWYRKKDVMISPALVGAYNLEHSACVPMIAISDELYDHLEKHPGRQFYNLESSDPLWVLRRFENLPNGKTHWFLDYIASCLDSIDHRICAEDMAEYQSASQDRRQDMREAAYYSNCEQWLRWHKDAILKAHAAAEEDKVKAKYVWLAAYHDQSVSEFFIQPSADLMICEII